MSNGRVTILGGTGFVGTQLSMRLAKAFSEVTLLSRRSQRSRALRVLHNVHVKQVDIHDADQLKMALAGSDVVINLVGILNFAGKSETNSFNGAHKVLTQKVITACEELGIQRYLHMSALNADAEDGSSEYLRSKGEAEKLVRKSTLDWTLFRPSVIFGEKDAFFNRFAALLKLMPVFPLACPDSRMSPVYVGDVCQAMVQSLQAHQNIRECVTLCGPKDYSLQELVEYTAETSGNKRKIIRLSDKLARLQARAMEYVPEKPFSMDNYLSLQTDAVCPEGVERQSTSVEAVVPRYIAHHGGVSGKHQTHRSQARR